MPRYIRPRIPLPLHLLAFAFLAAAATPALGTYTASAQDSPSLMEICEGEHDSIEMEDPKNAQGELRFTIIATEDKVDEGAAIVAEPERRFHRWGVGWHGDPGIRFRSQGGWYFTLRGRVEPYKDEDSRVYQNYSWHGDGQDYDKEERTARSVYCSISRQYSIWRGLSLGPVLELSHHYTRTEVQSQDLYVYDQEQTYSLYTQDTLQRGETYGAELGVMPVWNHAGRFSLETRFSINYTRSFSRTTWKYSEIYTDGSYDEGSQEKSYTDDGFDFDNKYFSIDMALGLYFYF